MEFEQFWSEYGNVFNFSSRVFGVMTYMAEKHSEIKFGTAEYFEMFCKGLPDGDPDYDNRVFSEGFSVILSKYNFHKMNVEQKSIFCGLAYVIALADQVYDAAEGFEIRYSQVPKIKFLLLACKKVKEFDVDTGRMILMESEFRFLNSKANKFNDYIRTLYSKKTE